MSVSDDVAVWVPEGGTIPITDGMADFSDIALGSHKLAVFLQFVIVIREVAKPQLYPRKKLSIIWLTKNTQYPHCLETCLYLKLKSQVDDS